jgi:hypothetical protein
VKLCKQKIRRGQALAQAPRIPRRSDHLARKVARATGCFLAAAFRAELFGRSFDSEAALLILQAVCGIISYMAGIAGQAKGQLPDRLAPERLIAARSSPKINLST